MVSGGMYPALGPASGFVEAEEGKGRGGGEDGRERKRQRKQRAGNGGRSVAARAAGERARLDGESGPVQCLELRRWSKCRVDCVPGRAWAGLSSGSGCQLWMQGQSGNERNEAVCLCIVLSCRVVSCRVESCRVLVRRRRGRYIRKTALFKLYVSFCYFGPACHRWTGVAWPGLAWPALSCPVREAKRARPATLPALQSAHLCQPPPVTRTFIASTSSRLRPPSATNG
ncbi:uncharacterized protein IWZ02DRAFT_215209 [Phyllosticta citriasiana]|uniref:uncharacterized protein n=1 Tax=Phyllosticta citriasiana TaxID=595635 RepID=UPI0030FDE2B7